MKQNESGALILSETKNGERIVSCGGRISTRPGTAIELYRNATNKEKQYSHKNSHPKSYMNCLCKYTKNNSACNS